MTKSSRSMASAQARASRCSAARRQPGWVSSSTMRPPFMAAISAADSWIGSLKNKRTALTLGASAPTKPAGATLIANDGELRPPTLLKTIEDPDGNVIRKREPKAVRRVLSERAAKQVRRAPVAAAGLVLTNDSAVAQPERKSAA